MHRRGKGERILKKRARAVGSTEEPKPQKEE